MKAEKNMEKASRAAGCVAGMPFYILSYAERLQSAAFFVYRLTQKISRRQSFCILCCIV